MMRESRFSIGMASSRSSPLPCGTPSMISIRTTSANSLAAIQCAAVAPTFPEPTTVTFLRISSFQRQKIDQHNHKGHERFTKELQGQERVVLLPLCTFVSFVVIAFLPLARRAEHRCIHVLDDVASKLAGLDLGGAFHQPLEVVCDFLFFDG